MSADTAPGTLGGVSDQDIEDNESVRTKLIRVESKIDLVLGRHELRLDDHDRRLQNIDDTLREHATGITANALTIAETRSLVKISSAPKNVAAWVAIGITALAVVLSPILSALIER